MAVNNSCRKYGTLCRVLTILWLIAAVAFSVFTLRSCDFAKRGSGNFGLLLYGWDDECVNSYPDGFPHGWLHTWAAICGALAPILGAIIVLIMLVECFCNVCCAELIMALLLTGAEVCQAFTFLLYASDACNTLPEEETSELQTAIFGGCKFGQGSIYSWIAFGCFFVGGCFLCFNPTHDPLFCKRDSGSGSGNVNAAAENTKPQAVVKEEKVFQDEENSATAEPQSPIELEEEVKPQVY